MTFNFNDNEWAHFHDVVLTATGKNLSRTELEPIFHSLDEELKADSVRWGLNDTIVRENIIYELKQK